MQTRAAAASSAVDFSTKSRPRMPMASGPSSGCSSGFELKSGSAHAQTPETETQHSWTKGIDRGSASGKSDVFATSPQSFSDSLLCCQKSEDLNIVGGVQQTVQFKAVQNANTDSNADTSSGFFWYSAVAATPYADSFNSSTGL